MLLPKRTDKETLERLLASGKLTPTEAAEVQLIQDAVVAAGRELDSAERLKTNILYDKHDVGGEGAQPSRRRGQAWNGDLIAKFDAMPRPKKPPGK